MPGRFQQKRSSYHLRLGLDILFTFMLSMRSRLYVLFAFMVMERSNDMLIIFSLLSLSKQLWIPADG